MGALESFRFDAGEDDEIDITQMYECSGWTDVTALAMTDPEWTARNQKTCSIEAAVKTEWSQDSVDQLVQGTFGGKPHAWGRRP